ncbi:Glucan endo-1,3-beta-glucosidase 7 [Linum grandiflorum]
MGIRAADLMCCLIFLFSAAPTLSLSTGSKREKTAPNFHVSQKDITAPTTTVPIITPATTIANPVPPSDNSIINPNSDPDSSAPTITPTATSSSSSASLPGASWCVASQGASTKALQVALDYACGYGGADCGGIQPAGSCYNPNTIRDHASYAFNNYYQKNPLPTSCNFGGTAVITSTNPSTGNCKLPSTSTSSSVLNTTNSNGATVFGAVPTGPSSPFSISSSSSSNQRYLVVLSAIGPLMYALLLTARTDSRA